VHPSSSISSRFPLKHETALLTSNVKLSNPFERLRSLDLRHEQHFPNEIPLTRAADSNSKSYECSHQPASSLFTRPLKSCVEQMQLELDDFNDSSISSANRSIHLPVEKQRGISEIIRKRNSRFKVEDYKRSYQRSNTFDEQHSDSYQPITLASNEQISPQVISQCSVASHRLTKTKSFDTPTDIDQETSQQTQLSIERLNQLLADRTVEYVHCLFKFRCRL
jgi:hypothetical protein